MRSRVVLSRWAEPVEALSKGVNVDIAGLAHDSRQVTPGNLFVAVKGLDADGHDYIPHTGRKLTVDVILAFMTSVVPSPFLSTDFFLEKFHLEFPLTGLKTASVFRMAKLVTLHRSLILRRLGKVAPEIRQDLDRRLEEATGLQHP